MVVFLRKLANRMGWTFKRKRKGGLQQALEDVKTGNIYEAESIEDLMTQLNT